MSEIERSPCIMNPEPEIQRQRKNQMAHVDPFLITVTPPLWKATF